MNSDCFSILEKLLLSIYNSWIILVIPKESPFSYTEFVFFFIFIYDLYLQSMFGSLPIFWASDKDFENQWKN